MGLFDNGGFDPSQHESDDDGFSPIPKGEYDFRVVDVTDCTSDRTSSKYIKLHLAVVSDDYENRRVFDMIVYDKSSEKAVKIGRSKIGDLCRSAGIGNLQSWAQLSDAIVRAFVKIKEQDGYEPKNVIARYLPRAATHANPPAPTATVRPGDEPPRPGDEPPF